MWTVHRGQKRASVPWTGDTDVASWLISPRNQTQVLCKMRKYFNCWVISPALVSFCIKSFINFWHSNTYDNDHFLFVYFFSLWLLFLTWDVCSLGWHQTSDHHISVFYCWNYKCVSSCLDIPHYKKNQLSLYIVLFLLSLNFHSTLPSLLFWWPSILVSVVDLISLPCNHCHTPRLNILLVPLMTLPSFMAFDIIYILMTLTCISLSQNISLELQTDKSN